MSSAAPTWGILLIAGLALLAIAVLGSIVLFGRGLGGWGQFASRAAGLLWVMPVVAVGMLVIYDIRHDSAERTSRFHAAERLRDLREDMLRRDLQNPVESSPTAVVTTEETAELTAVAEAIPSEKSARLPDWVKATSVTEGDTKLLVVSSRQYATVEEAERDANRQAFEQIRKQFAVAHPDSGGWAPPASAVDFRLRHDEEITRQTENASFTVYRVHKQLAVTPAALAQMEQSWRSAVSERRLISIFGLVAFLTLITGATSLYLRTDGRTSGQYRGRLKLATVSMIVAGGLALVFLV